MNQNELLSCFPSIERYRTCKRRSAPLLQRRYIAETDRRASFLLDLITKTRTSSARQLQIINYKLASTLMRARGGEVMCTRFYSLRGTSFPLLMGHECLLESRLICVRISDAETQRPIPASENPFCVRPKLGAETLKRPSATKAIEMKNTTLSVHTSNRRWLSRSEDSQAEPASPRFTG